MNLLRSHGVRILSAALLSTSLSIAGWAQNAAGFGSISGVVMDQSGAVVSGAKVVVQDLSKGVRRELTTNKAGQFNAPELVPDAAWEVVVTSTGFSEYDAKDIRVEVGSTVTINPRLSIGASETVSVSLDSQLLDQTKTDVSQVVSSRQILDLPINGRRVDNFVLLTPGVTSDGPFGLISFRGNPGGKSS